MFSPANSNELFSMELSWAWELAYKEGARGNHTAKDPTIVFLAEMLTDDARLEFVQRSIGFDHR